MQFPKCFFDDEVRDGFYVNGMMKRCWSAQLEVLSEVDKICRRHGIRWFADCGTLLGAVRHGGFIPWDDDLDICMLRADYERFQKVAGRELPEGYDIRDYHDEDCWDLLLRINNSVYLNLSDERLEKYHGFPFIAGIDIFPLDFIPEDPDEAETWQTIATHIFFLTAREDLESGSGMSRETGLLLRQAEQLCGRKLDHKRPVKIQLYDLMTGIFSAYKDRETGDAVLTPYWLHDGSHRYSAEWFRKSIEIPFECGTIRAPHMYDAVLRTEYGTGYMSPVHHGGVHEYPYYEDQERMLKEANQGFYPFWYDYPGEGAEDSAGSMGKKPREQAKRILQILGEAETEVGREIESGDAKDAVPLLEQCQGLAIQLGELIEKNEGEGHVTVKRLEEYCEGAYLLHEAILEKNREEASRLFEELKKQLQAAEESFARDIPEKKEIVFLPWKSTMWDAMKGTYEKWSEDHTCRVSVVPLPYYDKKPDNSFGELHYEGDLFPSEIPVIHYENYDFASRQPDVIYIQNPYDECNYTTSIHPFFYAKNLKSFTERLIYLPWFRTAEISQGDERAKKSMEHYAAVPGVVYADRVIVQSEQMKQTYVDFLTEWAGENTRSKWEDRIVSEETAAEEGEYRRNAEQQRKLREKKKVFYYTSASIVLEKKKKAIEKLREVFAIFHEQRDLVELLWYPDPMLETVLPGEEKELYDEYRAVRDKFEREAMGELSLAPDIDRVLEDCDAYYGDPGSLVQKFVLKGLPVMLQDVEIR